MNNVLPNPMWNNPSNVTRVRLKRRHRQAYHCGSWIYLSDTKARNATFTGVNNYTLFVTGFI